MCMQWKDKRDVRMLPSCIPEENFGVVRRVKEVAALLVINIYNNIMGEVGRSDQTINSYPVEHKRLKKMVLKNVDSSCQFLCI